MKKWAEIGKDGSDVEVSPSPFAGESYCCNCSIVESRLSAAENPQEMLEHLRKHQERGHVVPQSCFDELAKELLGA